MRRSSLVAPVLLIAVGALFLARNLYPDLPLIDYLARYWPFLLMGWGLLRLVEVVFWASTSQPLPVHGVSGGEWALVIFLCFFGASLQTVRGFSTWWPRSGIALGGIDVFGESFEYPLAAEKAASKSPHVVIESFRGNARIIGGDTEDVKITGRQTVRSLNRVGADRANQDSPLEIAGDATRVVIRTNQDRVSGNLRLTADMEITVPKNATIEAHGRAGDFDVSGIVGGVEITSDRAGVRLHEIGGDVRLDLRRSDIVRASALKGGLDLKGSGSDLELEDIEGPVTISGGYTGVVEFKNLSKPLRFNGPQTDLNIEKLPGEVRMPLGDFTASNLVGPIRLSTRSRDVQISDFTNSLEVTVDARGDIDLRPGKVPLARIEAHTRSGDVELSLPTGSKFDLVASTGRGDVTNDYGGGLRIENTGRRGTTLRGSEGGGPTVRVETDRGQVVVRRASADDRPLAPHSDFPKPPLPPLPPVTSEPLKRVDQ
jgi:DUF4097 and DUF4098 domain-containing protein YvlB